MLLLVPKYFDQMGMNYYGRKLDNIKIIICNFIVINLYRLS